jgi:hypothetical protein
MPTNNRKRAEEAAAGRSNIADAEMMEAISLSEVRMMVTEWVPFGENNIVAMAQNLGVLERFVMPTLKSHREESDYSTIARSHNLVMPEEEGVFVYVRFHVNAVILQGLSYSSPPISCSLLPHSLLTGSCSFFLHSLLLPVDQLLKIILPEIEPKRACSAARRT